MKIIRTSLILAAGGMLAAPVLAHVLRHLGQLRQRVQLSLQVEGREEVGGPVFEAELEKRARGYIETQWPTLKRLQMA